MNFSCSKPDKDNDISFEFEADIKNSKNKTVELISSSVIILNKNEICAGGSGIDFIDAHIEPGEIERIEIVTGWNYNASLFDNDFEQIKAIVNLSLLRRSFNKIEKLEVPNKKGASSFKKKICIDDILNISGIDVIFIGPNDLASSMGLSLGMDNKHPEHQEAVNKVYQACSNRGIPMGIHCGDGKEVEKRINEGMLWMPIASDVRLLKFSFEEELKKISNFDSISQKDGKTFY